MNGSYVPVILGILLVILMSPLVAEAREPLQIVMDANSLIVREAGGALSQYRYGAVPFKPYVKELFTPDGVNVLLDAPSDHLHHHALMFACAVNNVDFWGEAVTKAGGHFEPQPGKQQHLRFDNTGLSHPRHYPWARFTEAVRWISQRDTETLLLEQRTITVGRWAKTTLLLWESKLSVPAGKDSVVLGGSHYHGLGLRFIRSMDAKGEFRNPDSDPGVVFRGDERLTRSRWCAYTAMADGKTVTAAMFDHPDNSRHPATWFTMAKPFAYMSATMRLHEEPLKIVADKPLILRYGVVLWDGRAETSQIDGFYRLFTGAWHETTADRDPEIPKP